jgi:phosphohistidine phosphatase
MRHAKSEWADASVRDIDRPLNERGSHDAPRMGKLLRDKSICPALIISSDAVRALTTAQLVARELGYPIDRIRTNHALYLASPDTLLEVLSSEGDDYTDVMLVAHNPGMTELANRIVAKRIDNLPTCGVFMIETDLPVWGALMDKPGSFTGFLSPKQNLG